MMMKNQINYSVIIITKPTIGNDLIKHW